MSHETLVTQIKELDALFVQASQSDDPTLWEDYKKKVHQFEQEAHITRIPRDEPVWKFLLSGEK